jgi:predicted PhzF superfamily epimerase YddE/YHI9
LCGHATLASAFILFTKYFSLADVPETIILHTRESGLFTTELLQPTATHPLLIQMNVPEKPLPNRYVLERDSSSVAKALDCSASEVVYSGECTSYFGLVEVDSSIDLQNLKIDSTVLVSLLDFSILQLLTLLK